METPASAHLRYREEDHQLLTCDELARHAQISRAFIQLCLEAGCPRGPVEGRLSQAKLLEWLFANYAAVRALAGLRELAPLEGLPPALLPKMRMANAILTLLEFSESRASHLGEKARLRLIRQTVEQSLDRA